MVSTGMYDGDTSSNVVKVLSERRLGDEEAGGEEERGRGITCGDRMICSRLG